MDLDVKQLKEIAIKVGLTHSPNISAGTLRAKLDAHMEGTGTTVEDVAGELFSSLVQPVTPIPETPQVDTVSQGITPLNVNSMGSVSEEALKDNKLERLRNLTFAGADVDRRTQDEKTRLKEAMRQVRCIITCNNKNKTSWNGEIITVRNAVLPERKQFVPFGVPTHVPNIVLNVIKERELQVFKEVRLPNGNRTKKSHMVKEFNIQYLPPLTNDELEAIKKKQLAEGYDGE